MTEIRTASELDALPVGSVVRLGRGHIAARLEDGWGFAGYYGYQSFLDGDVPATVLFRPDAPQPATTDAAVERAARAWHEAANEDDAENYAVLAWEELPADLHAIATRRMALALTAARAGEAEPVYCPLHGDLLAGSRSARCAEAPAGHERLAAQRGGEAVDREALAEHTEVADERVRQATKGYDAAHDDRHGAYALARMAQGYVLRGLDQGNRSDFIKAAAVLESAAASFRRLGHPLGTNTEE